MVVTHLAVSGVQRAVESHEIEANSKNIRSTIAGPSHTLHAATIHRIIVATAAGHAIIARHCSTADGVQVQGGVETENFLNQSGAEDVGSIRSGPIANEETRRICLSIRIDLEFARKLLKKSGELQETNMSKCIKQFKAHQTF